MMIAPDVSDKDGSGYAFFFDDGRTVGSISKTKGPSSMTMTTVMAGLLAKKETPTPGTVRHCDATQKKQTHPRSTMSFRTELPLHRRSKLVRVLCIKRYAESDDSAEAVRYFLILLRISFCVVCNR